jgi:hypothetical protein
MNLLTIITQKLDGHPVLMCVKWADGIRIDAPDAEGFAVQVFGTSNGWTVRLGEGGAWHEQFSNSNDVLNFVAWCYSGKARLREARRGKWLQAAILEAHGADGWYEESRVVYPLVPFWRPKRETVFLNPDLLTE